jgi:muconate cycloisomerase
VVKIERVEILVVVLPERRKHPSATFAERQGHYVLLRVFSDGVMGLGEATVLKEWGGDHGRYYGESPETTALLLQQYLAPAIIGEDPRQLERLMEKLDHVVKGYPYAKAAIDIAVHDLVARSLGVPVYQLLGGAYRTRISMAHSLGILEGKRLLDEVAEAVSEGCRTIKLKAGVDPERDVQTVADVRKLVGDHIDITVDANQGWQYPKTAIQTIRRMEPYRVLFVEQPVEGLEAMARVAKAVDTPIMADESAWTAVDVLEIARLGAAEVISIYTTKPGGLHRAVKVAAVTEAAGFTANVNGSAETGVGTAANVHLSAAMKVVSHACVYPVSAPAESLPTKTVGRSYLDDIITEPFGYEDGSIIVSDKPGLGVELDPQKLAKYQQGEVLVIKA